MYLCARDGHKAAAAAAVAGWSTSSRHLQHSDHCIQSLAGSAIELHVSAETQTIVLITAIVNFHSVSSINRTPVA